MLRLATAGTRPALVLIPRSQWKLEQKFIEADGQRGQLPLIEMVLSGGFQPGYIYELIYEAEGSLVQGTGFAGIRDLVSLLGTRYKPEESACG